MCKIWGDAIDAKGGEKSGRKEPLDDNVCVAPLRVGRKGRIENCLSAVVR
jgi:hypothetical protein